MSEALTNSRALVPSASAPVPAIPAADLDRAADYAKAEKAEATRRAYRGDFARFTAWCSERAVPSLPAAPETVAAFLGSEAARGVKPSTIGRRAASVAYAHKLAGHPAPTDHEAVKATVRGIRRTLGTAPARKAPAVVERLLAMLPPAGRSITETRDRALLLLGFAGAFRRSELVALDLADLDFADAGLRVTIRRAKADQEGQGATIAVPRGSIACPVEAVQAWLAAAGIEAGPVFRAIDKAGNAPAMLRRWNEAAQAWEPRVNRLSDRSVANIVKHYAERAGLDPTAFAGHSLRSGFITSADARGARLSKIMDQSRHKRVETVRGYIRDNEIFRDHAGDGLL